MLEVSTTVWKSLCGDVVLDSFNKVSRDTDIIFDQIYEKQICSVYFYDDFKIYNIIQ